MRKIINNKRGEIGCIAILLFIVVVGVILFTDTISNWFGQTIAIWSKIIVILLLVFIFGTFVIGSGPRWNHSSDPFTGLICVGIVVAFIVIDLLFPNFIGHDVSTGQGFRMVGENNTETSSSDESDGLKNIVPIGRYATDDSLSEEKVFYTPEGECYHKTTNCPSLNDSDIIYKAYKEDACGDHRACGICY